MMTARKAAYSEFEKNLLYQLVEKHHQVLESKETNGRIISQKNETWEIVAAEFAVATGLQDRSAKQLKKLWFNMKQRSKAKAAAFRQDLGISAGGGPPTPPSPGSENNSGIMISRVTTLPNEFAEEPCYQVDPKQAEHVIYKIEPETIVVVQDADEQSDVPAMEDDVKEPHTSSSSADQLSPSAPSTSRPNTPLSYLWQTKGAKRSHKTCDKQHQRWKVAAAQETILEMEAVLHAKRLEKINQAMEHEREFHVLRMTNEMEIHELRKKLLLDGKFT